ncbi:MAG TPA: acylphosphatase [Longimicrobiaceae bacterium]|nr:acylphosphatase [Longimicrobiaceae bacterium]
MTEAAYRVRGRVQGVGFRWWTRSRARGLGLAGTVRNCPDGSVEVRVRGPHDAVAALRDLLRRGPPGSHVELVEELPATPVPGDSFEIAR